MMKSKIVKYVVNGTILAAIAALGIAAFQLGTEPIQEVPKELASKEPESEEQKEELEPSTVNAGTDSVEAEIEDEPLSAEEVSQVNELVSEEEKKEETVFTEEQSEIVSVPVTAPEIDFSEDTLMEWPVNGNILIDYSMDQTTYFPTLDQYRLSSAICVQAVENAPVVAAVNGTVFSIEEDVRTGTTVTMELGNGYQAVYGQLTDLTIAEGDTVKKGTIIGYISSPTKYYSVEGNNLYFAMKKNGEPIDPIVYLP